MSINLNQDPHGGTLCLSKAGLKLGDGAKTGVAIAADNGAGIDFVIDGIFYHKADSNTNLPLTAAAAQALLTTCLYLIQVDANLAVTSVKGREVLNAKLADGSDVLEWPKPAAGKCPIGAVKIVCTSTATFTAGTTALDAANVAETYYDLMAVPANPLQA
jgi:hypothetical protein